MRRSQLHHIELSFLEVMLSVEEMKMCLEHLKAICENRKKGALKAAEMRRKKKGHAESGKCAIT